MFSKLNAFYVLGPLLWAELTSIYGRFFFFACDFLGTKREVELTACFGVPPTNLDDYESVSLGLTDFSVWSFLKYFLMLDANLRYIFFLLKVFSCSWCTLVLIPSKILCIVGSWLRPSIPLKYFLIFPLNFFRFSGRFKWSKLALYLYYLSSLSLSLFDSITFLRWN